MYGPAMISLTYCMSFIFSEESQAQNATILLNFIIGALGAITCLMLRGIDSAADVGKRLEFIFALLPSFNFNFGYFLLLSKVLIYLIDYPDEWYFFFYFVVL